MPLSSVSWHARKGVVVSLTIGFVVILPGPSSSANGVHNGIGGLQRKRKCPCGKEWAFKKRVCDCGVVFYKATAPVESECLPARALGRKAMANILRPLVREVSPQHVSFAEFVVGKWVPPYLFRPYQQSSLSSLALTLKWLASRSSTYLKPKMNPKFVRRRVGAP